MKPKLDNDSKVIVTRTRRFQTHDGRLFQANRKEVLTSPLNLGSIRKPNPEIEDIVQIECHKKQKRDKHPFENFFGGLFGGDQ